MQLSKANNNMALRKFKMESELVWRQVIEITPEKTPFMEAWKDRGDLKEY